MKSLNNIKNIPNPIGPYSTAIISNFMLYVSGQIGLDPDSTKLVQKTSDKSQVQCETEQILKNLDVILKSQNLTSKNVVMTTIFLINMKDFQIVNSLYEKWINIEMPPARQTVAVCELPANSSIEISIIAEMGDNNE